MKHLYLFSLLFLLACNNGSEKNTSGQLAPTAQVDEAENTAIDWSVTDMLEFIYYPDPANQKVYRHVMIKDASLINAVINNLQGPAIEAKECIQNSKFYLFSKGEVYKTVYVSDSCNYLAYAVNSSRHFVGLGDNVEKKIDSLVSSLKK